MVFTVSYLLAIFIDIPACRQIGIKFVTKTDLDTIFFCNPILTVNHFCNLLTSMHNDSESHHFGAPHWNQPLVDFNGAGACIKLCLKLFPKTLSYGKLTLREK